MSSSDLTEVTAFLHDLTEPIAALVSNADAARRLRDAPGVLDVEVLLSILDDMGEDSLRALETLRRLQQQLAQPDA